jgi:hypothetical protein
MENAVERKPDWAGLPVIATVTLTLGNKARSRLPMVHHLITPSPSQYSCLPGHAGEVGVRRTIAVSDVFPHAPSRTVRDSFPSYGSPFRIDRVGYQQPGRGEVSDGIAGSAAP